MEIRTKFKPKDKIWVAVCIKGTEYKGDVVGQMKIWAVASEPIEIAYIIIKEGITYCTIDGRYHNEQDCFATEEEAEQECRRRNGKEL